MNTIKSGIFLVVGIIIYVVVFNAVNPEVFFSQTKGEVTAGQITANSEMNYIGYQAGVDIERITSSAQMGEVEGYVTVESNQGQALGLYKIKNKEDMENLKYIRNSKGRKVYDSSKKIYEYVTDPGSLKGYYNSYYLVGLQDGTYIAAYLDESYGKKLEKGETITLPVGRLEEMSSTVKEKVKAITGVSVNSDYVLNCFNEENFQQNEGLYVVIRGVIALLALIILYGIICLIFPKARLWE